MKPLLQVRPARPADQESIRGLLATTHRPSVRSWAWESRLGDESFLVAVRGEQLVGALLARRDAGPVAWVRLGVLGDGIAVAPWLEQSLELLLPPLRRRGARVLAWMDVGDWVGAPLAQRGFRPLTRIVTLVKSTRRLPPVTSKVQLRPVRAADVTALLRVDHAAFSPPWWFSREMFNVLREGPRCFLLAERDGQCVGYVEGQLVDHGAHIGRLAVSPLWQEHGVGSKLLAAVLECLWQRGARQVTLNTQEDNRTSQHLYLRFGFNPVGRLITAWQRAI